MAPLGALSQAGVSAEASLPLGWQISGLWRFEGLWVALSEGPSLRGLRQRLRAVRGPGASSPERSASPAPWPNHRLTLPE